MNNTYALSIVAGFSCFSLEKSVFNDNSVISHIGNPLVDMFDSLATYETISGPQNYKNSYKSVSKAIKNTFTRKKPGAHISNTKRAMIRPMMFLKE